MQFEIIATKRLNLRRLTPFDLIYLFEHSTKEEIKKELGLRSEEAYLKEEFKYKNGYTMYNRSMVIFQLFLKSDGRMIGSCGFHNWMAEHNRAEIGYHLFEHEDKRKGYMKEALETIIDYGFNHMGLNRIEACTSPNNHASIKLLEKFDFKEEGLLREHYVMDEIVHDSLIFSLLSFEYKQI